MRTQVIVFSCFILLLAGHSDGATTVVTCDPDFGTSGMCGGRTVDLTCQINGPIDTGISWSRPPKNGQSFEIYTCSKPAEGATESKCYSNNIPGYELLENSTTRQVLRINSFGNDDLGAWICQDGNNGMEQKCNVTSLLDKPVLPELKARCEKMSDDSYNASCTRITDRGNPPISMILSVGDVKHNVTNNFSVTQSVTGGSKVTCYLDGPASSCVQRRIDSTMCPRHNNIIGIIIGSVLGGLVAIAVVVFAGVWWFKKNKKNDDADIATSEPLRGEK